MRLWRYALGELPVELAVNLGAGGFSLRGANGAPIFAADIDASQYELLLAEWGEVLGGAELARRMGLAALERSFAGGRREKGILLRTARGPLTLRARFPGDPASDPFLLSVGFWGGLMPRGRG